MSKIKTPNFENYIKEIDQEILKRKNKWTLTAISWMDFNDVAQILRFHIYKKWHLYNSNKPLTPWINRIISNQIKNLIRNNYSNYTRPCLKCSAAEGETGCAIYQIQCKKCPLYKNWEEKKKNAYCTKITFSLENHKQEIGDIKEESMDLESSVKNIHTKIQYFLKPIEWKIYQYLYIQCLEEEKVAKLMGYKTTEKNRSAGYKQIKNLKKSIFLKVKKHLYNGDIDIL
jgi:hypothetical protein